MSSPANEPDAKPRYRRLLRILVVADFLLLISCGLIMFGMFFWDDVWGTLVERMIHYPSSELVRVDYGVYGTGDYGAKIHLRWTADSVAQVQAHYDHFPLYRSHAQIIDNVEDYLELSACNWSIGFNHFYDDPDQQPCNLVLRTLRERGGTIIEFHHSIAAP